MYMASHTLLWSHGTVYGRYSYEVLDHMSRKPLADQVEYLVGMGYSGIHLDRHSYADNGRAVEDQLHTLLREEPLVSPDGRDVFYTLLPYRNRIRSQYSDEEWEERQQWYRSPVVGLWGAGADRKEGDGNRWCRSPATLTLVNPLPQARTVTLYFQPAFPPQEGGKPPHLSVTGALFNGTSAIDTSGTPFSQVVTVPPGNGHTSFRL